MEVRDYIALADNLCTERAAFEGGWDEMRRIIMPRATAMPIQTAYRTTAADWSTVMLPITA